jgi:hypothetical protein
MMSPQVLSVYASGIEVSNCRAINRALRAGSAYYFRGNEVSITRVKIRNGFLERREEQWIAIRERDKFIRRRLRIAGDCDLGLIWTLGAGPYAKQGVSLVDGDIDDPGVRQLINGNWIGLGAAAAVALISPAGPVRRVDH